MPAPVKKLRRFLESCLELEDDVDLVLYSINVAGRKAPVWKSSRKWTIDDAVPLIAECSQEAANGFGNTTRFALLAFRSGDEDRSTSILNMSWALAPSASGGDDDAMSEPATDQGLLAQLMRHNSDLHRQSTGTWGMMFSYLTNIIDKQATQIDRLGNEKMSNAAAVEELVSKKHERDMDMEDRKAKQKRLDDMFGKVATLLPVVVNKIAGKELVRQNDTLLELTSTEFVGSLKPSQLDALLQTGALDKHQLALISTMLEQANKRMISAEERATASDQAQKAATNGMGTFSMLSGLLK